MARLNGVVGDTLNPPEPELPPAPQPKAELKVLEEVIEAPCIACGVLLTNSTVTRRRRGKTANPATGGEGYVDLCKEYKDIWTGWHADPGERICLHCVQMLSVASGNGRIGNCASTLRRIADAAEQGMVMILRDMHFGTHGGGSVALELGDVFKVKRAGAQPLNATSYAHARELFTIDINVGPVTVTLYPYECSPIKLLNVMQLQHEKNYNMAFVSKDDQEGYFTLTPQAKEQVRAVFGDGNQF